MLIFSLFGLSCLNRSILKPQTHNAIVEALVGLDQPYIVNLSVVGVVNGCLVLLAESVQHIACQFYYDTAEVACDRLSLSVRIALRQLSNFHFGTQFADQFLL